MPEGSFLSPHFILSNLGLSPAPHCCGPVWGNDSGKADLTSLLPSLFAPAADCQLLHFIFVLMTSAVTFRPHAYCFFYHASALKSPDEHRNGMGTLRFQPLKLHVGRRVQGTAFIELMVSVRHGCTVSQTATKRTSDVDEAEAVGSWLTWLGIALLTPLRSQ